MVHIPDISVQKNAAGKITHVVIDIEQQKELAQPVLERLEVAEDDDFDTAFANEQTLEKSEAIVVSGIKENYEKQRLTRTEHSL